MNCALEDYLSQAAELPQWLLCINDDLHPDEAFARELWEHRHKNLVTCPAVDYTSCPEQAATGPLFESPRRVAFVPAICWLMPAEFVQTVTRTLGDVGGRQQLFDESLGRAWYEDNMTARIWQKFHDPLPFLIAPTAWARHEGSRTSNLIPQSERWAAGEKFAARCKELDL
jgi:hypothetical protein